MTARAPVMPPLTHSAEQNGRGGQAYEGTLRQMVTDDKGTSLLTVFGLPPWSHENDALFGVRAALEIRKLFESLCADWAIAVTTGARSLATPTMARANRLTRACPSPPTPIHGAHAL